MNPLNFGTLGLPKSRKGYGNGVPIVLARWNSNTVRVMPIEGKGGQSTHSREITVPDRENDRVRTYNRVPRKSSQGIYQKMILIDSLKVAYESVNSKSSEKSEKLDETSIDTVIPLHMELKDHSFRFKPIKKGVDIVNKNDLKRSIVKKKYSKQSKVKKTDSKRSIDTRDKIVQKAMYNVLEEIYEGEKLFLDCSHGLRPGRSPHTAIRQPTFWTGVKWFIEGDISKCSDRINPKILVKLLEYEINDREFIDIIRKGLKSKHIDLVNGTTEIIKIGTPPEGIVSPILSNIYLHELDLWITECLVKPSQKSGKISIPYKKIHSEISNLSEVFKSSYTEEILSDRKIKIRKLEKERRLTIPGNEHRIYYVRYADNFLIGVNGSYDLACKIREKIDAFLKEELSLELNMEKTKIVSKRASFLGAELRMNFSKTNDQKVMGKLLGHSKSALVKKFKKRSLLSNRLLKKRIPNGNIIALAPLQKIVEGLEEQGVCKIKNFSKGDIIPKRKTAWINLPIEDIILKYNSVWQGILSYYSFSYNRCQLNLIQYLLEHSLACTLMNKLKLNSRARVFKKFGRPIKYYWTKENETKIRTIQFKLEKTLARTNKFNKNKLPLPDAYDHYDQNIDNKSHIRASKWRNAPILRASATDNT